MANVCSGIVATVTLAAVGKWPCGRTWHKGVTEISQFRHTSAGGPRRMAAEAPRPVRSAGYTDAMEEREEMMGRRDFKTTLIYADYAPSEREAEGSSRP
jgi:hypothetical protein